MMQDAGGKGVTRSISFTQETLAKVDRIAEMTGASRSWVIGQLIETAGFEDLLNSNNIQQEPTKQQET